MQNIAIQTNLAHLRDKCGDNFEELKHLHDEFFHQVAEQFESASPVADSDPMIYLFSDAIEALEFSVELGEGLNESEWSTGANSIQLVVRIDTDSMDSLGDVVLKSKESDSRVFISDAAFDVYKEHCATLQEDENSEEVRFISESLINEIHLNDTQRATCEDCRGGAYWIEGDSQGALKCLSTALAIASRVDDLSLITRITGHIADVYRENGDDEPAIKHYEDAIELAQQSEDKAIESKMLMRLSLIHERLNRIDKAIELANRCVECEHALDNGVNEVRAMEVVANFIRRAGRIDECIVKHNEALALAREIKSQEGEAQCLHNVALAYLDSQDIEAAEKNFRKAYDLAVDMEHEYGQAVCLSSMGIIYFQKKEYRKAIEYYQQSIETFQQLGHWEYEVGNTVETALCQIFLGEVAEAKTKLLESIENLVELRMTKTGRYCYALYVNALCELRMNNPDEAMYLAQQAIDLREELTSLKDGPVLGLMPNILETCQKILNGTYSFD